MDRIAQSRAVIGIGALCLATFMTGCCTQCQVTGGEDRMRSANGNRIRLEHTALNVADPVAMAAWYVENLNMRVKREGPPPVNARFLADARGNMMLELYHNPPDGVPDYASMDPLLLHIAFLVDDVDAIRDKLLAAGATSAGEVEVTPAGDKIAMLRDPWGLAIQFIHRADPMLMHR
jgi:catechol 2,3-dioxygenase-like lactoylglutathione lyase family enzyme